MRSCIRQRFRVPRREASQRSLASSNTHRISGNGASQACLRRNGSPSNAATLMGGRHALQPNRMPAFDDAGCVYVRGQDSPFGTSRKQQGRGHIVSTGTFKARLPLPPMENAAIALMVDAGPTAEINTKVVLQDMAEHALAGLSIRP